VALWAGHCRLVLRMAATRLRRPGPVIPSLLVSVIGAALSFHTFTTWQTSEAKTAEMNSRVAATARLGNLRRSIGRPFASLLYVEDLIESVGPVDESTFKRFAGKALHENPEIRQLIWAPIQAAASGAPFDAAAKVAPNGFTSAYVLPSGPDSIVGRDIESLPGYGACLNKTADFTAHTDRVCVVATDDGLDIFTIVAVESVNPQSNELPMAGAVAGRIHLILTDASHNGERIGIFDLEAPGAVNLLDSREHFDGVWEEIALAGGVFQDLRIGSESWRLVDFPPVRARASPSRQSLFVLATCLFMTANLAAYIYLILRRRRQIEETVDDRTRELSVALLDLRLSEQRLQSYVSTASDWYWESDKDLRFTQVTAQVLEHKIEPRGLIGLDRLTEDDAENEVAQRCQALASHQTFRDLRYDYGGDRGLLTLSLSGVSIFGPDGSFLGYRGSARDITLQLQVDARQRQARWTAEQANRAKSNFLATMSHEIRTPMNGVLGMVQTLRDTALDDEQRRMCDVIYRSGNLLHQILNDILDYSKLEAGKITLESISSSLAEIVESVAELMRGTAEASGLTIEVEMTNGVPAPVMIDPTRLRQVLFNLVSNAIKFSEQGVVSIRLRAVSAGPDRLAITLAISDQGIGISSEAQRRLFTRFSQADSSTTRRYGGTGLGLAITMELVTLMGGTISVFSKPGQGATFIVKMTVPIAEPAAEAPTVPTRSEPPANARILDILVAEDNTINQEVIHGLLRGHRLTMVDDGAQAVEAVQTGRFDLVLMDVMMPILNGLEATAAIRALATPAATVPIIALTANSMSGDRELYLGAGMNDYISKPIEREKLFEVIQIVTGVAAWRPVSAGVLSRPAPVPGQAAEREVEDFLASLEP
jgi:signal transduction histidine kinase/CheY-like chemotaxis protein